MELKLYVPDMACSACRDTITAAIQAIDPAVTVRADLETKWLQIETTAPEPRVRQVIQRAGYTIKEV
ncbi:heavy-metal-associated domain-containing protein [Synechococcus sp. PCC 6717]|jgi:copper chaperone|uniref:Heavy metal transporter n=1 Tax=Parathermosynechococcus lividus PCC 6715 TaxID=1917166 RepID=A0A2D2Q3F9_PARLV|nr:heavy-metal-associated domain-containing protein [Thermostichus lividus]ATS19048.1 heavy metal transporter [Thermostichus lividus PCC 6715]MCI3280293.1 heavy-metal-associated domain-containing protein [Synechococcus sp. PCC 6717]